MPDVQLHDVANGSDRLHVVVVQTMTGVHFNPQARGELCAASQAFQLDSLPGTFVLRVGARVELDDRCTDLGSSLDLRWIRIDEQTNTNAVLTQGACSLRQPGNLARNVQTSLGRNLLALLRNETTIRGTYLTGNADHFIRHGHFQVHMRLQKTLEHAHIVVLNVPPILTQMKRDAVSPGHLSRESRMNRVRIPSATRLPQRCNVI